MATVSKKGIIQASLTLIVLALLLLVTAVSFRKYLHLSFNQIAWQLGFNFNNIATDSYVNWINSQSGDFVFKRDALFLNKKVPPLDMIAASNFNVLGQQSPDGEKWIDIDLSKQRLYMKKGDATVGTFLVSSGKWYPTPTGSWRIWTKLKYTRMRGGSKIMGTYYDLPNVPYVMYFYQGYGIHGAYWHNNFGQPMSHGCINMKPDEAGIVFNWAPVGTEVVIHE